MTDDKTARRRRPRFRLVEDNADRAASYWRSIMEAAHRGETLTCAIHPRQVRLLTFSTVQTLKALIKESGA